MPHYMSIFESKPFLKWAGGKRQLLSEIERFYPFSCSTISKYAEPFVGGGAVLFDILNKFNLKEIYISDTNERLINCYRVLKDNPSPLIDSLESIQNEYLQLDKEARKDFYYKKRDRFNALSVNPETSIEIASLMIFLNKTCFNALYRVNKKGHFNVPVGAYKKNISIYDKENLINVSKNLQNVTIVCEDYTKSEDFIDSDTFVYIDPPYRPISTTSSFTSYTKESFNDEEQIKLSEFSKRMSDKGAKILISNSYSGDSFFETIYSGFKITKVQATRMINSNPDKRGKIEELLISNF